jgi:hypothetical protein
VLDVEEQLQRYGAALEADLLREADGRLPEPVASDEPLAVVPRRRSRARRRALVGIATLVAVSVVVAVVVGTGGGREHVASGPTASSVFGEPTHAVLLTSDGIDGVTAIDLDHRIAGRRVIEGERAGDQLYRITLTRSRLVVGWGAIYASPLDGGRSTKVADATQYLPAAEPGEVWTIDEDPVRSNTGNAVIQRVTTSGRVTFRTSSLDIRAAQPQLGVPGGLVVRTPDGTAVWDAATGTVGPTLGPFFGPTASNGRSLAWCVNSCADLHVVPLAVTGPPTAPHGGSGSELAFSNDRRWLAYLRPVATDRTELVRRDLATGSETVVATGLPQYGSIAWSADSAQLFYSESYGQRGTLVGRYVPATGRWQQREVAVGDAVTGLVVLSPAQARSFFSRGLVAPAACPGAAGTFPSGRTGRCSFHF